MMARILLPLLIISLMSPAAAHAASGGRIALYSDAGLSECALTDMSAGVADVYVFHNVQGSAVLYLGVAGISFALLPSSGFDGTWLEDIVPAGLGANGTSPSGTNVGSLTCWFRDKLLLHVRYQVQGGSSSCSFLQAVPYPGFPSIDALTCGTGEPIPVDGDRIFVNPDGSCPCDVPVAIEPTTWGRIKAMYRD